MSWDLLFTLPNLAVPTPSPYVTEGLCLCAADDPRLLELAATPGNATAGRMLDEFRTSRGEVYQPACLLVDEHAPAHMRNAEALRAFRNVCAVATTTRGCAAAIKGGQWIARWSDHFFFSYFVADRQGWVQTLDGAARSADNELPRVQSSPAIGRPAAWHICVDEPLCQRLLTCWRRYFLMRRDRRACRRLFRALEVAFHAGHFPGDGLTSINDVGTRIGLWVSAFETLCHPGNGGVNKLRVLAALKAAPLGRSEVAALRYVVTYGGQRHRVAISGDIYDDLYNARNRFLHGNPVTGRDLRYRRSSQRLDFLSLAPVVFNVALLSYLEGKVGDGPTMPGRVPGTLLDYVAESMRRQSGLRSIQGALNAARYPLDEYGHPLVP